MDPSFQQDNMAYMDPQSARRQSDLNNVLLRLPNGLEQAG